MACGQPLEQSDMVHAGFRQEALNGLRGHPAETNAVDHTDLGDAFAGGEARLGVADAGSL
ncbi:hypothetical protein F4561_005633 [Lipingzhangella halophila]|uniref:Uncharacterized protein n=1 Tax=Lipingzhangella halophila TaxID=1783352 RepID=A0A7W7W6B6_9ACTN|nr:hypothetical protein [Lipingzhangella halophila]